MARASSRRGLLAAAPVPGPGRAGPGPGGERPGRPKWQAAVRRSLARVSGRCCPAGLWGSAGRAEFGPGLGRVAGAAAFAALSLAAAAMQAASFTVLDRADALDAATSSHGGLMTLYCPAGELVTRVTGLLD